MNPSAMKRLFALSILLLVMSGCVIWPHTTSQYEVRGLVFDNLTLSPISKAEVRLRFPETREEHQTQTRNDGSFLVRSEGQWNWILYFWSDDEKEVPVEMTLTHPGYEKETVEDLTVSEHKDGRFLDVGSLYLDRKR